MLAERETFNKGRLQVQAPKLPPQQSGPTGLQKLRLDDKRDGMLYVPPSYSAYHPAPVAVMLHGAAGDAEHGLYLIQSLADENNIILIAPVSRSSSWDIISLNRFGPDVVFINQALAEVFENYTIDVTRLAIGGFSDGASYALSLGMINGDLFTHIIAFSPGFYYAPVTTGKPKVFISHGTKDAVLSIDPCSRRIVPRLEQQGYKVSYHEFNGPHTIPDAIKQKAVRWFLAPNGPLQLPR